jgi:hypothetical protein
MIHFDVKEPRRTRVARLTQAQMRRLFRLPADGELMEFGRTADGGFYFLLSSAQFPELAGGPLPEIDIAALRPKRRAKSKSEYKRLQTCGVDVEVPA